MAESRSFSDAFYLNTFKPFLTMSFSSRFLRRSHREPRHSPTLTWPVVCTGWVFPSSSLVLFDATVAHGLGFAHALAGHLEWRPLVGGHAALVRTQVRLHLLPHLLFWVQLFVWLPCGERERQKSSCGCFS